MSTPKRSIVRKVLRVFVLGPVFVYAGVCSGCWLLQDSMIYPRQVANVGTPEGPPRAGIERVWIPIESGGQVEAWFILGARCNAESPAPAVMFFHGNGALIDYSLDIADLYTRNGISVLLPEYRGYGRSGGTPSQRAITSDMVRFRDWLDARPEVDRSRVVYHGQSLGGGVAAALAEERPPAAFVLQSTFTSICAMAVSKGLPSFLVAHPYRTDDTLSRLRIPTLIVHGTEDTIIPLSHGRCLHEVAPGSEFIELEGGHNDLPRDWEAFQGVLLGFFERNGLR